MEPFSFNVDDFDVDWLTDGPGAGPGARVQRRTSPTGRRRSAEEKEYDLKVNHPLTIGDTEVFLIGHGYAPVVTVRDGNGDVAYSGPTVFLPQDQTFLSFGVVKAPDAEPDPDRARGAVLPDVRLHRRRPGQPSSGDDRNPLLSMLVYTGDLGMDDGGAAVGLRPRQVQGRAGAEGRRASRTGSTCSRGRPRAARRAGLGDLRGRRAVEQDPDQPAPPASGSRSAGVVLALVGLLGSLFIRPRRVWVRARRDE